MYVLMDLTAPRAYWLAGLLEGEGSFLHRPPSSPNTPRIALEMTDADVVERAASLMKVRYIFRSHRHPERGWKPAYRIALKGVESVRTMLALRPLMGALRRSQIDAALIDYGPRRARIKWEGTCVAPGCARPTRSRRLCRGHYQRFLDAHEARAPRLTAEEVDPHLTWPSGPELELQWLAGLLEGEATFSRGRPSAPRSCRIQLKMCEQDVVEHARNVMVSSRPRRAEAPDGSGWRAVYETVLADRRAETLMRLLRPLMGTRRQREIDAAIASRGSAPQLRLIDPPDHCVVDSCAGRPRGRGLCHKHYMRWLRHEGREAIRERRRRA